MMQKARDGPTDDRVSGEAGIRCPVTVVRPLFGPPVLPDITAIRRCHQQALRPRRGL